MSLAYLFCVWHLGLNLERLITIYSFQLCFLSPFRSSSFSPISLVAVFSHVSAGCQNYGAAGDVCAGVVPEPRPAGTGAPPRLTRSGAVHNISNFPDARATLASPVFTSPQLMSALGQALSGDNVGGAATENSTLAEQKLLANALELQITEWVHAGASTGTANKLPAKLKECVSIYFCISSTIS